MYKKFFGLNKAPFKITPDPEFFFSGGNRGAVLEALIYAVARGEGIVKVVGEVGSGKTMLCRMLEHELPRDCEIVYIANPHLTPDEILHAIAVELKLDVVRDAAKLDVMRALHDYLLDKHAHNKRVVMFIEEAQGMALATLEEIRLLSNLETTQDKLLQIVLFGQPELNDKLAAHEIRQLRERITYAFDLAPLNRSEIRDYVTTRIRTSGFRGNDLFSAGAIRALARGSRGLLRRINILADKALLAAFSRGDRQVRARHVRMAARDSEFASPPLVRRPALAVAGGLAFALIVAGAWWTGSSGSGGPAAALGSADVARPAPRVAAVDQDYSRKLPDDEHTIADDASDIPVSASPPAAPAGIAPAALAALDLGGLEPDTSPALRPETLPQLLR